MIRFFDIAISVVVIVAIIPVLMVVAAWIVVDSGFPVFYSQKRVGKGGRHFKLWKFRTMYRNAAQRSLLTIGENDNRITRVGRELRRWKLDELPQLFNVLWGSMSLVGPRPEVPKYVALYTEEQRKVLTVKPGITDWASIAYSRENEILARSQNPEKTYIEEILPHKIALNLRYLQNPGVKNYFEIIWATLIKVFGISGKAGESSR